MFKTHDKVVCSDKGENVYLTEGRIYVIRECFDDVVKVENDVGYESLYNTDRFVLAVGADVAAGPAAEIEVLF